MDYDAVKIGDWFIEQARQNGQVLSVMKILKLTYIAHGWHLALYNGEPLYSNRTEAWRYGPVVPELYHAFKSQGINVTRFASADSDTPISGNAAHLLPQIDKIYGGYEPWHLSYLTHVEGGPWHIASQYGWYAPIPDELIKLHYDKKLALADAGKTQNA